MQASDGESSIEEQLAQAEKSVASAGKNRMFGVLQKTLVQLCKAVKAGRPNLDRLVQTIVLSICQLDNESLLKIGADLSNLLEVSLKHSQDAFTLAKQVIERIGSRENDMVVFALNNKEEVLLSSPSLIKEVAFDLVKYYFKSQPATVEV